MDNKANRQVPFKRLLLFLCGVILAACLIVPIPYYIEGPGETVNLKELITVNGQKDEQPGSFSLTSVGIRQATVFSAAKAKFSDFYEVVDKAALMGNATDEEYDQIQTYYMESSQNNAIQEALKLAGKDYTMKYNGVYVLGVEKKSAFYGQIMVGDTVTKADGKSFTSSQDFMKYVQSQKVGQEMEVTYLHDGQEKNATGKLMELPSTKKPGIGITLTDHTEIESAEKVKFKIDDIGGPSAGLMFTLEIYQQVSGKDLRQGKKIAGTGTVDGSGNVGQIGGIDKKVASASADGCEYFFAPDEESAKNSKEQNNYQEAKAAAKKLGTKMKIIPVKKVQDAVDYLEKL